MMDKRTLKINITEIKEKSERNLGKAIELLLKLCKQNFNEYEKDVIQLQSQFNLYQKNSDLNTISFEETVLWANKTLKSLLNIIQNIEKDLFLADFSIYELDENNKKEYINTIKNYKWSAFITFLLDDEDLAIKKILKAIQLQEKLPNSNNINLSLFNFILGLFFSTDSDKDKISNHYFTKSIYEFVKYLTNLLSENLEDIAIINLLAALAHLVSEDIENNEATDYIDKVIKMHENDMIKNDYIGAFAYILKAAISENNEKMNEVISLKQHALKLIKNNFISLADDDIFEDDYEIDEIYDKICSDLTIETENNREEAREELEQKRIEEEVIKRTKNNNKS